MMLGRDQPMGRQIAAAAPSDRRGGKPRPVDAARRRVVGPRLRPARRAGVRRGSPPRPRRSHVPEPYGPVLRPGSQQARHGGPPEALLVLALATWWAHQLGPRAIRRGERRRFGRAGRRDVGVAPLGRRWRVGLVDAGGRPPLPFRPISGGWVCPWLRRYWPGVRPPATGRGRRAGLGRSRERAAEGWPVGTRSWVEKGSGGGWPAGVEQKSRWGALGSD